MKKLLVLLGLLICTNVSAKTTYTDYEEVGYTFEEKSDNELYKYEPVTLNRFYKLVNKDAEYLERGTTTNKTIDLSDYKIETIRSNTPSKTYENKSMITIKSQDNYIASKLILSEITDYKDIIIKEIEIYNGNNKLNLNSDTYPSVTDNDLETGTKLTSNTLELDFGMINYVDEFSITIHYIALTPFDLRYTINNETGSLKVSVDITLDNKIQSITINTLKYDKYETFIKENNLKDEPISYHYQYDKILYKHYTINKDYYKLSEEDELDGYLLDPNESIKMYKVYRREKIETETEDTSNKDCTLENVQPDTPKEDPIVQVVTVKEYIPCKEETTTCQIASTNEEEKTYPAVLDTTKNELSITDLEAKEEKDTYFSDEEEKCEKTLNWWLIIGLALVFTSIVLTVLHYIGVKREENND